MICVRAVRRFGSLYRASTVASEAIDTITSAQFYNIFNIVQNEYSESAAPCDDKKTWVQFIQEFQSNFALNNFDHDITIKPADAHDIVVNSGNNTSEKCAQQVVAYLNK